jgi:hypothetical protein
MSRGAGRGNVEIDGVITTAGQYKLSDLDGTGDPAYYGYLDSDGGWYIMELNSALGTARYIKGDLDYATNWTGRAGLTYGYYSDTF